MVEKVETEGFRETLKSFWDSTTERMPLGTNENRADLLVRRMRESGRKISKKEVQKTAMFIYVQNLIHMDPEEREQHLIESRAVKRATVRAYAELAREGFLITSTSRDEIGEM